MSFPSRCPGPMTRRHFLGAARSASGACPAGPVEVEGRGRPDPATDTAVILLWLPGGPPHLDMYDMKPDAPAEYRGEFRPIKTNVPGIEVCEHLPLHAKCADKYAMFARCTTRSAITAAGTSGS